MPLAKLVIDENSNSSSFLTATNVRDLQHVQRLLLQTLFATLKEGDVEIKAPIEKLTLLRNFLITIGANDSKSAQRMLILGLFSIADEVETKRIVLPDEMLKFAL